MEFPFDCEKTLGTNDSIVVLDSNRFSHLSHPFYERQMPASASNLARIIDTLGEASSKVMKFCYSLAQAQGLSTVITSASKFFSSENQRLYVKADGRAVLGILKVGQKNLFIRGGAGGYQEIKPLCVLDFYVHESVQRLGVGKDLFELMLEREKKEAKELGYDRPSPKLMGFLAKHYNLRNYSPQSNNFVVFNEYFTKSAPRRDK